MWRQRIARSIKRHRLVAFIITDEILRIRLMFALGICSIVMPICVSLASYADGTLVLPQTGKGLMQHFGMWSFFITTPIIVALLIFLLHRFFSTFRTNLERYCIGEAVPSELREYVNKHLASLMWRTNLKYVLTLMCITGAYFSVLNILRTIEPLSTYGNDVFDAYHYPLGFSANKLYILFVFSIVYPIVGYVTVHTTVSLFLILRKMQRNKILRIDFFHADNCGGVSRFGTINVVVMAIYICILSVIVALIETHDYRQRTTTVPLLCTSGFLVLQSVGTVYYLHKAVQQQKHYALEQVNGKLNQSFGTFDQSEFPNHLLGVRTHLLSMKTYPYSGFARSVVNVIRTAPAVWALVRLWV